MPIEHKSLTLKARIAGLKSGKPPDGTAQIP